MYRDHDYAGLLSIYKAPPPHPMVSFIVMEMITRHGWLQSTPLEGKSYNCTGILIGFTSKQHLTSYQDMYRLVTVHTHDDFIVLPHWETRPSVPWPDIPLDALLIQPSRLVSWLRELGYNIYSLMICHIVVQTPYQAGSPHAWLEWVRHRSDSLSV